MSVVNDYDYKTEKEKLVLVNGLSKLAISVKDAEANANYDVLKDAGQVESSVSCARDTL